MKKVTLSSATDELVGAASASGGVVGGSILMKMAPASLNPWLVSVLPLLAGYGIRLVSDNSVLKDIGTGLLIAGALDLTKKAITQFGASIPALQNFSSSIPSLSGVNDMSWNISRFNSQDYRGPQLPATALKGLPGNLRGMRGLPVGNKPSALLR